MMDGQTESDIRDRFREHFGAYQSQVRKYWVPKPNCFGIRTDSIPESVRIGRVGNTNEIPVSGANQAWLASMTVR